MGEAEQQQRWSVLSRHIDDGVPLTVLSQESGVSLRTLQRWNAAYRVGGPAALARADRSDKGAPRLPGDMVALIEGLALVKPRNSLATITRTVTAVAQARGWPPAHYWVVRDIVAAIPDELMTLAHSGPVGWRDKYELVWRFQADQPNDLWQADHTELDILVRDQSQRPARPWLTSILDDCSRAVCGYRVFLGAPSTLNTGLALRQAI